MRVAATLIAALAALAAALAVAVSPAGARHDANVQRMASYEAQIVSRINALRAKRGLAPLRVSRRLAAAAAQHSQQMAHRGYFEHESADGTSMSDRLERFYTWDGFHYWMVGENLVWDTPEMTPAESIEAWLHSPPHRATLYNRQWREIGVSAVHAEAAPGVYGEQPATIVTADFGIRR